MEGSIIDQDASVEVVAGQVEVGSLIGQNLKKFVEDLFIVDNSIVAVDDIKAGSGSQVDNFVDTPLLESFHE